MAWLLAYLTITTAAAAGVMLALYIRYKKVTHKVMVCPLKSNCETVTHSEFSHFLGVPVELLGIAYYLLIVSSYISFAFAPHLASQYVVTAILMLSTAAFLFSLYLTFIQAFTLKQWCTWCLLSAGLCTIIFFTAIASTEHDIINVLAENKRGVLAIHILGLCLGLGGASLTDMFFFRFLKDWRVSAWEAEIMHTLSQIIWIGLAILVLSGIGLYLPQRDVLNHSSKFLVKVTVVGIILLNGSFLNLFISPRLIHISFGQAPVGADPKLRYWRALAFAAGAVSFTSWYTAFILGMTRSVPLSYGQLLSIYLVALSCAVAGSQVMGLLLRAKHQKRVLGVGTAVAAQPSSSSLR